MLALGRIEACGLAQAPARRRVPDLGKLLFVLPNLFTMSAVLCGFYAITTLASGQRDESVFLSASLAIVFAAIF